MSETIQESLEYHLKKLRLSTIRSHYPEFTEIAIEQQQRYDKYLLALMEKECEVRAQNRIARQLHNSRLPLEKVLETFDLKRLNATLRQHVNILLEGGFIGRRENVLAFGNPGSGKTHLLCAIGHHLIHQGHSIYFTTCSLLVQELLRAKRDLKLDKVLKRLLSFEAIIIDDIGYVEQNRQEMEVLFTLLAQRYERGSVMLTSNLPFSKWENIFKDPMTTAAAIDRLVHHSVILELNLPSYRMEQAKSKQSAQN